jgi:hypothetical protein
MVNVEIARADGTYYSELFLIDTGADATVLSAYLVQQVNPSPVPAPPGFSLVGISGTSGSVMVQTVLVFRRSDGGHARVQGQFAAFVDPAASDYSILGREVLDIFDIILSRRRNEVLLLAPNHDYQVIGP